MTIKKKYLAWFISFHDNKSLNREITSHVLLIKKLCEKFEKIYLINIHNLKFFSEKKKEISCELNQNLKLPDNIEFINPFDSKDFANFMYGKELIAINKIGRNFSEWKVYFLFAKYKIKQIQISNLGNIQTNVQLVKRYIFRGILKKIYHDYSHKIIVLLSNLGLVPKIEIRFVTDVRIIDYKKKGESPFKKIFNYFNFHFAKEFILVNSRSFDEVKERKNEIDEDRIVLLPVNPGTYVDFVQDASSNETMNKKSVEKYFYYIKKLITHLSNIYNKKVIVCIHPAENLKLMKQFLPDFEIVQYKTRENIFKAFMVLFHDSSAIIDAILLKKRIITLSSIYINKNHNICGDDYAQKVGILKMSLEDQININKNHFISQLDKAKEHYLNYIKSNIAPDGNEPGHEKIIRIIKERFFN